MSGNKQGEGLVLEVDNHSYHKQGAVSFDGAARYVCMC